MEGSRCVPRLSQPAWRALEWGTGVPRGPAESPGMPSDHLGYPVWLGSLAHLKLTGPWSQLPTGTLCALASLLRFEGPCQGGDLSEHLASTPASKQGSATGSGEAWGPWIGPCLSLAQDPQGSRE